MQIFFFNFNCKEFIHQGSICGTAFNLCNTNICITAQYKKHHYQEYEELKKKKSNIQRIWEKGGLI